MEEINKLSLWYSSYMLVRAVYVSNHPFFKGKHNYQCIWATHDKIKWISQVTSKLSFKNKQKLTHVKTIEFTIFILLCVGFYCQRESLRMFFLNIFKSFAIQNVFVFFFFFNAFFYMFCFTILHISKAHRTDSSLLVSHIQKQIFLKLHQQWHWVQTPN